MKKRYQTNIEFLINEKTIITKGDHGVVKKTKLGHDYKIIYPYLDEINPEQELIDIEVIIESEKYEGSITTIKFIEERLNHYAKSGENKQGSYFHSYNTIIVKDLTHETLSDTLDDLINDNALTNYFKKVPTNHQ